MSTTPEVQKNILPSEVPQLVNLKDHGRAHLSFTFLLHFSLLALKATLWRRMLDEETDPHGMV